MSTNWCEWRSSLRRSLDPLGVESSLAEVSLQGSMVMLKSPSKIRVPSLKDSRVERKDSRAVT